MAELISQDNHALPDEIRLAILDSRLIPGRIENEQLIISRSYIHQFRKKLYKDYCDLLITREIYVCYMSQTLFFYYKKPQKISYKIYNFKKLFMRLFIDEYSEIIGINRCVILSNLALGDSLDNLSIKSKIPEKKIKKFLNGNCELRDEITKKFINKYYEINQVN